MTMPPPPPYAASGSGPSGPRAGFGARLGAWLIDGLIFGVPTFVLFAAARGVGGTELEACTVDGEYGICEVPTGTTMGLWILIALGLAVGLLFYEAVLTGGAAGQTIGKRAMGIRVIDFDTGGPIGKGRAIGRTLFRGVFSGIFLLGYLWMLWDREKQTWHDKVTRAVVVPVSAYPIVGAPSAAGMPPPPPTI